MHKPEPLIPERPDIAAKQRKHQSLLRLDHFQAHKRNEANDQPDDASYQRQRANASACLQQHRAPYDQQHSPDIQQNAQEQYGHTGPCFQGFLFHTICLTFLRGHDINLISVCQQEK
ncbi:hypothetical protein SDC9_154295 [bioreactor metagenome]|uniref:Uncharacterized protein n=1 Tax=bioreactor metagenome TaxID=1076179 RepID=A0A645F020_9ZZZZ